RDIEAFIGKESKDKLKEIAGTDDLIRKTQKHNNVTIFTMPKPMSGHIETIQRNAFKSWTKLNPVPEIFLSGNEQGIKQTANELKIGLLSGISENEFGTPLVNSIFS
ncbi:MAG: hypothetical protein QG635_1120, partial [Bacteroidota bacterium]|nr:hypothetical protein [Bacteroidota bacterium]